METKKTEKWKTFWNKYKFVALVAAVGILFLLWPSGEKKDGIKTSAGASQPDTVLDQALEATEERMAAILSKIKGVGQLELMLTLDKSAEQRYVQDTELSYSGQTEAPEDYLRKSETVILYQGSGQEGMMLEESVYPTYRGALVVCQGGDSAEVKLAVTAAVSALTGLSSDRITVTAWQN